MQNPFEVLNNRFNVIEGLLIDLTLAASGSPAKETKQSSEYLSGKEVDKYLRISSPTRIKWAKEGILTKYQIGGKVLYKKIEVEKALKLIEVKRG